MMVGLFSVFDPVVLGFSFNWLIMLLIMASSMLLFFSVKSWVVSIYYVFLTNMCNSLSGVAGLSYKGLVVVGLGLFMFIMFMNLAGLFPYVFTGSAHPMVTLSMGLVLWMTCFLMGWSFNFKNSAAHLTPQGSPLVLSPFLVLIESVSHLIRPFTLSIRLAANMMAGHLIIGLISGLKSMFFSVVGQSIMLILEGGVCVIQGVVFSILFLLYAVEYY